MKSGILQIYKPEGISSASVVRLIKKITGAKKVGHMGTLDPFATGLLLCGIEKGTRISQFFLNGSKRYIAKVRLGIETDTFDYTGTIVKEAESYNNISKDEIINLIKRFQGKQEQTPPAFSALKHLGKPLYKYAREGQSITKSPRNIEIFDISIEKIEMPFVSINVFCSAGTYIRTIAHDIGKKLGCGAHLSSLERTESCGFSLKETIALSKLDKMGIREIEEKTITLAEALAFMPTHKANKNLEKKIIFGQQINKDDGLPEREGYLRILTNGGELAAIVEYDKIKQVFNYSCVFLN